MDEDAIHVVPNGVAPHFAEGDRERFADEYGARDFVLYVGRVEPRKNVRGLIAALRPSGLPLVVIGDPPPGCEGYAGACRQAGGALVRWLASLNHDDPLLASADASSLRVSRPAKELVRDAQLAAWKRLHWRERAVVLTPHMVVRANTSGNWSMSTLAPIIRTKSVARSRERGPRAPTSGWRAMCPSTSPGRSSLGARRRFMTRLQSRF